MAKSGLSITFEQVLSDANKMNSCDTKFTEDLNAILARMKTLNNTWKSDTANSFYSTFSNLSKVFQQYHATVENYTKFLKSTVTTYETMENKLNSNAKQFQ